MMKSQTVRAIVLSACFLACSWYLERVSAFEPVPTRVPLTEFPMQLDRWQGARGEDFEKSVLDVLGVDDYINRIYRAQNGGPIGLYVGYYRSQRAGDTIHSPMNCLPGSGWTPISSGRMVVPVDQRELSTAADRHAASSSAEINRYLIQKNGETMLVLYWYQSHGRIVASEYWSKIYMVLDAIRLNRTDAALVRVVIPVPHGDSGSEERADAVGREFVRSILPRLAQHLPA
jgi:EpsI family protein